MQNLLRRVLLILLLSTLDVREGKIFSQCPLAESCDEAYIFCSLDELNGFSCNTIGTTTATCYPSCAPNQTNIGKRSMLAFVCQGGNVTLTLNVGGCVISNGFAGICLGIWGDCHCGEEILCIPYFVQSNETRIYQLVNLKPCKVYYIFFDHGDDNCDFTINTSGGGPSLKLGDINNVTNGIIEPVCVGYCNYKFTVNTQNNCVAPFYEWTLDGKDLGYNNNEIKMDFPNEGDFILCVSAYIRDPKSGPSCQAGPKCATVKVRPLPNRTGVARTLCYEMANPISYRWHSQYITTSGIYIEHLTDNMCCKFDSIVEFTVLPEVQVPDVYYISCDTTPFKDKLGRKYYPCKDHFQISLSKTTDDYKCDSAIRLTAINVDYLPQWQAKCFGSKVELSPNINILNHCNVGESYKFNYKWYKKSDTAKVAITTDERLIVDAVNEDYCLEVNLKVHLGIDSALCIKTFCELFNESEIHTNSAVNLGNDTTFCKGSHLTLNATIPDGIYLWQDNSTDSMFIVDKPGMYWVRVSNSCGTSMDTIIVTEAICQQDSCEPICKNIEWMNWTFGNDRKYFGFTRNATIIIDFDSLSLTVGPQIVTLTNTMFTPKSIRVLDPRMSNSPGVTKLTHVIHMENIPNPSEAFVLIGHVPNANIVNSKPQIQRLRAYDIFKKQLNLPDACVVFQDLLAPDNPTTLVSFNTNEITFEANNPTANDGGIVVLKGFPANTNYLELDHVSDRHFQNGGIVLDVGLPYCCIPDDTLNFSIIPCSGDSNSYSIIGEYSFKLLPTSGSIIVTLDGVPARQFDFPFIVPLHIRFDSLNPDGKSHTLSIYHNDYPDCIYTYTYIAPLPLDPPKIYSDSVFCENHTIILTTDSVAVYNWLGPNNFNSDLQNPILLNANIANSGTYFLTVTNAEGCTSSKSIVLRMITNYVDTIMLNACDSVIYDGQTFTKSGNYPFKYIRANGCDSIINVHINITGSNSAPIKLKYCDSVTINGRYYTQSGIYTQLLKSTNGCDSILNIDLTISKSNLFNYKLTSCDSALINGQWYLQSGNYTQTLQNVNQCDSTLNIDLNITKSTTGDTLFRSCDSVTINGQTYRQSGVYNQTLTNSNQCDSTLIIDFTRLSKSSTAINYKSCDSVVVNNQVYKQSGIYTQTFVNANQCDSILNLDVTIAKSNSSAISLSSCDSMFVNGQLYKQTGQYIQYLQNASQCDSVLNIDLTIHKSSTTNRSLSSCDSIVVNNRVYTLTGVYKQILTDKNGCDSSLNLQVNISNPSTSSLALTKCDSAIVNNQLYTLTGVYKQLLTNANGCDSTLTLDLIIKPGNPSTLDAGADTSICVGEIIKLNGVFSGQANFIWHSTNGILDNPTKLSTNYYPTVIGTERIYLQAADDCKQWLDSLAVQVLPKQIVQVTGDTILNPCKEISFTATGGTNYIWTPASLIECLDPACSRVRLKSTTNLMFTISTDGPCSVPANLNLSLAQIQTEVWLPNAFSPNGDNINDIFLPIFNCDQVDFYNLQIFDRWGNLVFESNSKDKGWDGKYQDLKMDPGVYPYVIQYQFHGAERKVKAGDITLIK